MAAQKSVNPSPRRSPTSSAGLDRILLACLLLEVGLVLFANEVGMLPAARNATVWDWLMLGAGSLLLISEVVRALAVQHSQASTVRLILGSAFLGLGLTAIFAINATMLWPAALLLIGLILLLRNISFNL